MESKKLICKINEKTGFCSKYGTIRPEDCRYKSSTKRCVKKLKADKTPTAPPTAPPTASPTAPPTASPTAPPTASPTAPPTASPTASPTTSSTAEVLDNKIKFKQKCLDIQGDELEKSQIIECQRLKEMVQRESSDDNNMLYPTLDDPNFNMKIAYKKEFNDTKYDDEIYNVQQASDDFCQMKEFELSPHQRFVRNFLSFQTPYNSLLLFHGLGTGKTCSAILVCEEMRHFNKQMGISNKIIIVASPNVQDNFRLQLFDERKLKNIDGHWTMQSCTSNSFINEVNPMNMSGFTKEKIIRQVKRVINSSYRFMGYNKFSNFIMKKTKGHKNINKALKKIFSDRLIVIDEVHNIRATDDSKTKAIIKNLKKVVYNADNLKLLLLSATPMFNTYKEIIWLLNLMNLNDARFPVKTNEIFDAEGNFIQNDDGDEIGKELFIQKATGYVSFVSGDNPYTFPYRILPKLFLKPPHLLLLGKKYPASKTVDGRTILTGIQRLDIAMNKIGTYQEKAYYYVITKMRDTFPSFANIEKGLGYQILEPPLQILNMAYPSTEFDEGDNDIVLYGKGGLNRVMKLSSRKKQYEYTPTTLENYGRIFSEKHIGKYSAKISFICQRIRVSQGIVLIYSQYIDGGCVPIALALEEMGFRRYGEVSSLFKNKPPNKKNLNFGFKPTYTMITGDVILSPNNQVAINTVTNDDNIHGEKIKVIIISRAASEGIDLKNIRQIHILDPWYNLNRTEQILGRGIRHCSHKALPFEERNTEIYMYGTALSDGDEEAVDLYIYRLAEKKAIKIGKVTRVLKENAVDCILNTSQTGLTQTKMKQIITQNLSSGGIIKYPVGSQPYTSLCDYMKGCAYKCTNTKPIDDINRDTYGEDYIILNLDIITQIIRNLFKEKYFYKKIDLVNSINFKKTYADNQIDMALNQLVNDNNLYITDMLNRTGRLINIANYYMFQPIELDNTFISRYNRVHPVDYKQNQLFINIPKKVAKVDSTYNKQIAGAVITNMKQIFTQLTSYTDKKAGHKLNWYQLCYRIRSGKTQKIKHRMSADIREKISKYGIHHFIDSMIYDNKLMLLNLLYKKTASIKDGTDLAFAKAYYDSFKITGKKNLEGLLLNKGNQNIIHIYDGKKWRGAKHTELELFSEILKERKKQILGRLNAIISFINYESNKDCFTSNCFKTLYTTKRNDRGALCEGKSKKNVIHILNQILSDTKSIGFNKYDMGDMQVIKQKTIKLNQPQLCCELELIMRYYTEENVNDKIWFLPLVDAIMSNIVK